MESTVAVRYECNLPGSPHPAVNVFSRGDFVPWGFVLGNFFGKHKKVPSSESKLIQHENKHCSCRLRNQNTEHRWAAGFWVAWPQWKFQFYHDLPSEVMRMTVCGPGPWRLRVGSLCVCDQSEAHVTCEPGKPGKLWGSVIFVQALHKVFELVRLMLCLTHSSQKTSLKTVLLSLVMLPFDFFKFLIFYFIPFLSLSFYSSTVHVSTVQALPLLLG